MARRRKQYGCAMLILDLLLLALTGPFWLVWIIVRQWRASRR